MTTQTKSITQTQGTFNLALKHPNDNHDAVKPLHQSLYHIEERPPATTKVPFSSPLSVAAHFTTWICWTLYFMLRLPSDYHSATWWFWLIYFCEVAFVIHDLQTAIELTFSLFGPRDFFTQTRYTLKGSQAPKVNVFVTTCGEDLSTVMDTIVAAAVQEYPPKHFQVFVLDDAADDCLRKAVQDYNTASYKSGSAYQDVVYSAREKPPGKRHYYKSGNLRAGLELTASNYGASEFFAALDADMISEPDWLARTVPHLIKNDSAALVSPPQISYNILEDDLLCQDSNVFAQILEPFRNFLGCSQCSGSGYVMRRRALDSIGGWPLANIGEDIVCSNALLEHGWTTTYIPDQLQYGFAPDSFHSYINQRIRWTNGSLLVGKHFSFRDFVNSDKHAKIQRTLSVMGALKAYATAIAFFAVMCLPLCLLALQTGKVDSMIGRRHLRLVFVCQFLASTISKKLVYGRLGSVNVRNMTTAKLWSSPFTAFCTLKSLFCDPGETSFKVSGTYISPADERYPARRKPLMERMLSVTMVSYAASALFTSTLLASFSMFVAYRHLIVGAKRVHMHTGVALKVLDVILAALVPVRYMAFPPSLPDRRDLLVKDKHGAYRSRRKGWKRRDGGSQLKFWLQIAIIVLYDWL